MNATIRNTVIAAAAFGVLVIGLAFFTARDESRLSAGLASSYNPGPEGVKAFYTLLEETAHPVRRWRLPPARLPERESLLFIVAAPANPLEEDDRTALEERAKNGATIMLFYNRALSAWLDTLGLAARPSAGAATFLLQTPAGHALLAPELRSDWQNDDSSSESYGWTLTERRGRMDIVYGTDSLVAVAEIPMGEGSVLVVHSPNYILNRFVARERNLDAIMRLVRYDARGQRRKLSRMLFDEYHQGFHGHESAIAILDELPVRVGLAIGLTALVLFVHSLSKRVGRPVPLRAVSRRSSLDYVQAVSDVYWRAHANRFVLKTWYEWVLHYYARKFRTTLNPRLAEILGKRYGYDREKLLKLFTTIETKIKDSDIDASGTETVARRAVAITDEELLHFIKQLDELYAAGRPQPARKGNRR